MAAQPLRVSPPLSHLTWQIENQTNPNNKCDYDEHYGVCVRHRKGLRLIWKASGLGNLTSVCVCVCVSPTVFSLRVSTSLLLLSLNSALKFSLLFWCQWWWSQWRWPWREWEKALYLIPRQVIMTFQITLFRNNWPMSPWWWWCNLFMSVYFSVYNHHWKSIHIQGVFSHWYPPKKLNYGKPRLGESTLT